MEQGTAGETKKKGKGNNIPPFFYVEKPRVEISREKVFASLEKSGEDFRKLLEEANLPTYLYWDRFKHKFPTTTELTSEEKWFVVSQFRKISAAEVPIKTEKGIPFTWVRLPNMDEVLHKIDMFAGGRLFNKTPIISAGNRHMFLNRGIIEEAIASSQLEGAHTTRKAAKKMLLENRKPKNESEQMILNNHKTMTAISEDYKERKLSRGLLFEMHSMLTENTVDPSEQNRFRKDSDEIVVQGQIGSEVYVTHEPPSEKFIEETIDKLIAYANDEKDGVFIHPILKAIFLHFWIGYLHPFTDGNGRLARSIFYWYLLRKGYWTFMYLPISTILRKVPLQYAMAYIYSEQDNQDVTYFLDFNLKKVLQAITEFEAYIDTKISEKHSIEDSIGKKLSLNDRQTQLIFYLVSEADPSASVSSHSVLHSITKQTAIRDLKDLELKGLIEGRREGKYVKYYPTKKLMSKVAE
jgi:Fic family protein